MAETSYLWDNPGTGDSPAGGYGHDELMSEIFRMLLNGTGNQGVLRGWLNELEVTDGGGLNADIATGGAIVYGTFFESNAAETIVLQNNTAPLGSEIVVSCDWATQTARLADTWPAVGPTQNPGVLYEIPLAHVITAGGAITALVDSRDFCEFTTELLDDVVEADHIQADAVTTAKLENQTRNVFRGAGTLEPDATNPATWVSRTTVKPYLMAWEFDDTNVDAVWLTFRVPSDYVSGTATLYLWNNGILAAGAGAGNVLWGWDSWDAQPSAALANQAGTLAVDQTGRSGATMYRDALTTLTIAAGDIFHIKIYRDGTAGGDTSTTHLLLHGVEIAYTADS